ncbi:GNAT family N-acetyltransferase [Paenibacillus sp. S150]|uniref:GNAT family N-acetyltransferase n=1 Tax=Paenibacillus sp. S150 TaxID=2749826 RepID=UPI001C5A2BA9|nr:GNAT family N-acetyltransferase [Paenibacillus sp. S150]MBW4084170.1 GNAT family N-acetyltransferase [Paenibacillus sp. S150]
MQISSIYDTDPGRFKIRLAGLLEFLRKYGEQRITLRGCRVLSRLTPEQLSQPGASLLVATVRGQNGRQLAGVSFVSGFGKEACLVAVHPLYRNRHTGTALLTAQLERLGSLECAVASDNAASLKMCFNTGLVAVALTSGPTGKPTLLLRSQLLPSRPPIILPQEGELLCQNPS